jgi:hypothetical protein
MEFRNNLSKTSKALINVAAVVGAITVIAGGYTFYLNYIWKPKVEISEVDFTKGIATVKLGNLFKKTVQIEGDSTYELGGDWGVRFGHTIVEGKTYYNRLELVRKNMVYEYINR